MTIPGAGDKPGSDTSDRYDPAWDAFVAATPGCDIVQSSRWAAAKRALGFDVVLAVRRFEHDKIGGAYIVIRHFGPLGAVGYISRGPLIAAEHAERVGDVLDAVEQAARARRVRHLIVQPPEVNNHLERELAARGYAPGALEVAPTATVRIDLTQDLDRILARLSSSQRNHLRRSQRAGVEVRLGGPGDVDRFQTLHEATARRHRFTPLSREYLCMQWDALHPAGWVQIFLASHDSHVLAAIWVTAFGDTVTYRLPGWSGDERKLYPNVACFWCAIQWAKASGYRYFDLGGIDRRHAELLLAGQQLPPEFQHSPDAMKVRFGAEPVLLPLSWHMTLNRVAWVVVRSVYPLLSRSGVWRTISHRLRNG